ncbi:SubName: Full=Uncharacterized protein {ECO:0000313/EMBL:CCA74245.1} [Serendipita indica DSM 11827]|nr:SubName: Full=Uncharacterized protein {ECO:0000313/EMBL:CCA74245.1} [Serendipita indica DSM 11827]
MSKDSKQSVLQFLDSLDAPPTTSKAPSPSTKQPTNASTGAPSGSAATTGNAAEALAFLDELTQQSSRPTRVLTPGPRVRNAPGDATRTSAKASPAPSLSRATGTNVGITSNTAASASSNPNTEEPKPTTAGSGGWGWGSVWNTASAALAQAKNVVEEQAKHLPNDQAKKWGEGVMTYVKQAQLDKIGTDLRNVGMSTLTQMINAVAPPIAEHEVIQIWLSHDMKGYEGVESIVYRSLARIMEQVEGGDLVVNRGNESKPKNDKNERDLGAIDGLESAYKLSIAELDGLVNSDILNMPKKESLTKADNPTTYSSVFLRIQPFYSITPPFMTSINKEETTAPARQLQFFLYLTDPNHSITHSTVSQVIPAEWLDVWDEYDWVEDLVVEALRVSIEIVGEQYLSSRMNWGKKKPLQSGPPRQSSEKNERPPEEAA